MACDVSHLYQFIPIQACVSFRYVLLPLLVIIAFVLYDVFFVTRSRDQKSCHWQLGYYFIIPSKFSWSQKVRQLLQNEIENDYQKLLTKYGNRFRFITRCARYCKVLQKFITKCVRHYKVCQGRLQSVKGITTCDGITKFGGTACYIQVKMQHIVLLCFLFPILTFF